MHSNPEPRSFRPAEGQPRPLIGLDALLVDVCGTLEAVRGEDGVWAADLDVEDTHGRS